MAIDLDQQWFRGLAELRCAATPKRLRALLGGQTVMDPRDALLVSEPRRVVPWYAVPPRDLPLDLTERDPSPVPELAAPVLPPHHNEWHTAIETALPVRWYLPREDVRMDLLTPSETHTVCAYKGIASYLSADGAPDGAWFYPEPLHDAARVQDLVCFWQPATIVVDGQAVDGSMPRVP